MSHWLVSTLSSTPTLTLFVVIGLGYVLGQVNFFGFRLGVAGVLFVGLAVGSLSPAINLPEVLVGLGLVIFLYTIGIQSGPAFFASFRKSGYQHTLLVVAVLVLGAALTSVSASVLGLPGGRAAGLYTGALTSTPALAAVRERLHDQARQERLPSGKARTAADDAVVGYSVAYPMGVIAVLLCFELTRRWWRPVLRSAPEAPEILVRNFVVRNPGIVGATVGEVLRLHRDAGFVVSRIQHEGRTGIVKPDTPLEEGDIVVAVGDEEALGRAQHIFGGLTEARIEQDRSQLDYRRVWVSSERVVGKRIAELDLQDQLAATITRLRRGDVDVVPTPDTRLEYGDRVRVLTRPANFPAVSQFFGDSIRGSAETDFGSVAIGMVLGALVGMAPLPLPGGSTVRLGLAGGPLIVALILGKLERSGRISWTIPVSANLTLRQIGLLLFLSGVGTNAGYAFRTTVQTDGLRLLLAGTVITFAVTMVMLVLGYKWLKMPFDLLLGLVSGSQTQGACVAFATDMTKSDVPNVAYASIYPVAVIVKIVLAQMLL
jgi:putative transport protein